jgi:thymidylate synthase (FAD)
MTVELLNYFGNDLMVVNAARVSYGKTKTEFDENDKRLLNFLVKHKHTSPFRHPQLQFRIHCPIFVERQLFKHQIGLTANCLHGDTKITFLSKGGALEKESIKSLYERWNNGRPHQNSEKDKEYCRKRISNKKLRVLNENTGEFEVGHIKNIMFSGKKMVYEIKTQDGKSVKCSADHRVFTKDGWKTINSGLSTADFLGLNGIAVAGNSGYTDYEKIKEDRINGLSVQEMADKYECSYHTIRKWLKIHKLSFSKEETYYKKNSIPWNKNRSGYKLNLTEEGRKKKIESAKRSPKGPLSHLWRGGITSERDKIGQWVRSVAKDVHKKYNYTCQSCEGKCKNRPRLVCHHIFLVATHHELAYDIDNLITLCEGCHIKIHKTQESEIKFAEKYSDGNAPILAKKFGKNKINRKGRKLKVHFSKIVSISKIEEVDTYDIEVDGPHHNFVADGCVVHNSISGRYVDFADSYYEITELRKQSKSSKQGSEGVLDRPDLLQKIKDAQKVCRDLYKELCDEGVAKEQARIVLPLSLNTTFIWTGSLAAFLHLWSLRLKPDAQQETREVAKEMFDALQNIDGHPFKYSLEAFSAV